MIVDSTSLQSSDLFQPFQDVNREFHDRKIIASPHCHLYGKPV